MGRLKVVVEVVFLVSARSATALASPEEIVR